MYACVWHLFEAMRAIQRRSILPISTLRRAQRWRTATAKRTVSAVMKAAFVPGGSVVRSSWTMWPKVPRPRRFVRPIHWHISSLSGLDVRIYLNNKYLTSCADWKKRNEGSSERFWKFSKEILVLEFSWCIDVCEISNAEKLARNISSAYCFILKYNNRENDIKST